MRPLKKGRYKLYEASLKGGLVVHTNEYPRQSDDRVCKVYGKRLAKKLIDAGLFSTPYGKDEIKW